MTAYKANIFQTRVKLATKLYKWFCHITPNAAVTQFKLADDLLLQSFLKDFQHSRLTYCISAHFYTTQDIAHCFAPICSVKTAQLT